LRKIRKVEIGNFRSFSELKIDGIGDINIIVGKNNTGKSTFLEALFLSIGYRIAPSILRSTLKTLFMKRGIQLLRSSFDNEEYEDFKKFIEKFFFYYDIPEAFINTDLGRFRIKKKRYSKFPISYLLRAYKDDLIRKTISKVLESKNLLNSFIEGRVIIGNLGEILFLENRKTEGLLQSLLYDVHSHELRGILPFTYERNSALVRNSRYQNYKTMIDTSLLCLKSNTSNMQTLIKALEKFLLPGTYMNLKSKISSFFNSKVKSIYPSFSDIYIETETEKIPFSLVGDGIKNLALNIISLNLDKPTYVFLEEPETFLHPKMMDVLSKEIVCSGKRNQVFLTTHSLEFVENLLYYAKKSEEIDVKVIGFYDLTDGKLDYEIYGKDQAYTIVNKLGEDIR